ETELGTLGLAVCADNFGSSLAIGHVLARMGAQVLLSPSAWAVDADHDHAREPYGQLWRDSYTELARLYDLTVIGVSNVGWITGGPWKGREVHRLLAGRGARRRNPGAGTVRRAGRGPGVYGSAAAGTHRPRDGLRSRLAGQGLPGTMRFIDSQT